jgi:ribonuclease-3
VITHRLFHVLTVVRVGGLSKLGAALVSRAVLAARAADLDLDRLLVIGQADALSPNALANALEAIIGAIYESSGLPEARQFVSELLDPVLSELVDDLVLGDYKSRLHEVLARLHRGSPNFEVNWTGPDHERIFQVTLQVEGLAPSEGFGRSRKEAEQIACKAALVELERHVEGSLLAAGGPADTDPHA